MLTEQKIERRYKTVIPELNVDFERAVYWWYEEAMKYTGVPDVVDLMEEHPYMQNIFDVIVQSEAMEHGGLKEGEEIPEGMFEGISTMLSSEYDKTVHHMLNDIKTFLNLYQYMYIETDFFLLDIQNPTHQRGRDFVAHNSALMEVW